MDNATQSPELDLSKGPYPKNMSFKNVGEEYAQKVADLTFRICTALIQEYELDASKFSRVVCTNNYQESLNEIHKEFGFKSQATFTSNELGVGAGKLMTKSCKESGEIKEHILVLRASVYEPYIVGDLNEDEKQEALQHIIHVLHHELGHVHDYNTRIKQMSGYLNEKVDDYQAMLLFPAKSLWDEYIANRLSSNSVYPCMFDSVFETLNNILDSYYENARESVVLYQCKAISLQELHSELSQRISFIFQFFGYSLGYISGLNVNLDENLPDTAKLLKQSKLAPFFYACQEMLDEIYLTGDTHWVSIESYEPLQKIVLDLYHSLGVFPSRNDEGLYLSIP